MRQVQWSGRDQAAFEPLDGEFSVSHVQRAGRGYLYYSREAIF